MTQKEVLSARLDEKTSEQLDEFADENSLSRSEAAERLIHQSLRIENGDVEIVPVSPDGGIEQKIDETRQVLQNQSSELHQQNRDQLYLQGILVLTIAWYAIVTAFAIPTEFAIVTGLIVFGGLSYGYYHYLRGKVDV
jgi:hypothetical protein